MARILRTLLILQTLFAVQCELHRYLKINLDSYDKHEADTPLFLTPYIESGNITEGRRLARVPFTDSLQIKSYAGYFTVNKTYNSNQFFWYFPALTSNNTDAPVLVWLQGGPGASSLFGLFAENGPLRVRDGKFVFRKINWALNHHIIYIDNPVGTGFSFTNDSRGYCTDQTQIGEQLYSSITQFFQLFPELRQNKFFVTGESYGGKYVPALAYTIHKNNPTANVKINLKGIAIGNGLSDPEHQMLFSKYLYQIGLIDWNQVKVLEESENKIVNYVKNQEYAKAYETYVELLDYDFMNMTGFDFLLNYLHNKEYIAEDFVPMLQKNNIRKDIHVGEMEFHENKTLVQHYLRLDFMQSVAPWISELLDYYNVVLYSGQLDIIVAYPLTVNYLRNLNFTGSDEYKTAARYIWQVDGDVAGYVKHAGKLVEIMVRNAGHLVPTDQPKWALDLITRFTHEKRYDNL